MRINSKLNLLFEQEKWQEARQLLEKERVKKPNSHWVYTQLAVTFYEEKKYNDAMKLLLFSRKIKDDCPLTLWHLAGTFVALNQIEEAKDTYTAIITSTKTPKDDPCWESDEWTKSLKDDSAVRLKEIDHV